jgi:hypothetical protein
MKRLLCLSAVVAAAAMLLILAPNQSLTAETNTIASSVDPIRILNVNLKTSGARPVVDGLEIQIQNASAQPIQYLVIHAVFPGSKAPLRVPLKFGNAPVPNSRSTKVELLQPNGKFNLLTGKGLCDRLTREIAALGRVPSTAEIQTRINVVVFQDKTAWAGGESFLPDPTNPNLWNAASEIARKSSGGNALDARYSKASYKTSSTDCFRIITGNMQYCCDDFDDPSRPIFVWNFNFQGDPNGHFQPNQVEACCPQASGCCFYDEPIACP